MDVIPSPLDEKAALGGLCGVWVDDEGRVHLSLATETGGRVEKVETLRPFAWLPNEMPVEPMEGVSIEALKGEGPYGTLVHAETLSKFDEFLAKNRTEHGGADAIRPIESQFLLQRRE